LNHPYLYRIYVSCINIELLSVWTQICTCFAFDKAVKIRRLTFYSQAWLQTPCQMSSCLCQDYNILLLFKRYILYTGNVEYILLCLCLKQKNIKIKQAFKNIQQPRTSRNISSGKSSSFNGNLAHAQQISQLLFAVINLRGVSTNKTIIYFIAMQTYKELIM
jgi:hypothetical protein